MEILELLQAEKVEEFNESRSPRTPPNLFAVELAGKSLQGVDFSDANLDKSDLTESDLSDSNLMSARMNGIDGTNMNFSNALGLKIKLRDAWLEGANLTNADFSRGNLAEAYLRGAHGERIRMSGTLLKEVDAAGVKWPEVDLSEATLTRADFSEADLSRADLTESSANGANFTGARLDGVSGAGIKLAGANLSKASLMGARLSGANLAEADLSGAHLAGADLSRANLAGANLEGANLQGAVLADATLDDVDLSSADLDDADLTGVDPDALSLSEEQREGLASYGAGVAAFEETRISDVRGAVNGGVIGMVWRNAHDDDLESIRWLLVKGKAKPKVGVLPVAASGVVAHDIARIGDGFEIVLLHERATGFVVSRTCLNVDGTAAQIGVRALGYEPVVAPVLRGGEQLELVGLARRGPTAVISTVEEEGLTPRTSERIPTGQGFLSRRDTIIMSKGGVLIPVLGRRLGKPLRTPDRFPGIFAVAAMDGEECVAAWVSKRQGKDKGGVEYAWLKQRGVGEVERLSQGDEVSSLDIVAVSGHCWFCWLQGGEVVVASTDGETPRALPLGVMPKSVQFISAGTSPLIAVTTVGESLVIIDSNGRALLVYEGS